MHTAPRPPLFFLLAIAVVIAMLPLLYWVETQISCGDGLCFLEAGMVILGSGLTATIFVVLGWLRGERPRWLITVPLVAFLSLSGYLTGAF